MAIFRLKELAEYGHISGTVPSPYKFDIHPTSVTVPYRTVPNRHFSKIPVLLKVKFFAHRCMQRYIEKYAVTSIVTLNCNGKYTVAATVTVFISNARLIIMRYGHRYIFSDA